METRRRCRAGKSTQAAASDPPVRPPSPVSGSEEESEAELANIRATGVMDRDPTSATQPGDTYQTPSAGDRARIDGAQAEAPPSPVSLAQGGLATLGDGLSVPDVDGVDPVDAIATAEAQNSSAGPPGPQGVEVLRPPQVEQSDIIETTYTHPPELDAEATQTHTLILETHFLTLVPSEPGDPEPRKSGLPSTSRFDNIAVSDTDYPHVCDDSERQRVVRSMANPFDKSPRPSAFQPYSRSPGMPSIIFHRS